MVSSKRLESLGVAKKDFEVYRAFAKGFLENQKLTNVIKNKKELKNSVTGLNDLIIGNAFGNAYQSDNLSQTKTMSAANNYNLITRNWLELAYAYTTHGLIQTIIDQPVEDALRGGLDFTSDQLSPEELKKLDKEMLRKGYYHNVKQSEKWRRLFGGSGLIIAVDQPADKPLRLELIGKNTPLRLISADRWELMLRYATPESDTPYTYNNYSEEGLSSGKPIKLHVTRVVKMSGKEAPSFIKRQLQGWGLSCIEHLMRNLNNYFKGQNIKFELEDQIKLNIMKIKGYNKTLLSGNANQAVEKALQLVAAMMHYKSLIAMDAEDDFDQKQVSFSGIAELEKQNMISIASDFRMPMTKLFGLSASGFNAGEDDIENYNCLIESEIRASIDEVLEHIMPIICMKTFGFVPDDLEWKFKPLRILSAEQEENVKTAKFNRHSQLYQQGIYNPQEYAQALKQDDILTIDTEVAKGAEPEPPEPSFSSSVEENGKD